MMEDSHNFSKAANASESLNFKAVCPKVADNDTTKITPPTQSFDARYMNAAWTVCYGTTFIILMFLLILWYYFERQSSEYTMEE